MTKNDSTKKRKIVMNMNPIVHNNVDKVKREIEKKTEKMIENAYKNGTLVAPRDLITATEEKKEDVENVLKSIMGSGAKEFNEKVGRPLTYGEMREMWG
jgi:GTP-binding protein EngB required for normal cell division